MVNIIASVGIAAFMIILFVTLNAEAYTAIDPWEGTCNNGIRCNNLDGNLSLNPIGTDINAAVESGFESLSQTGQYIPLFVLLVLAGAFLVLTRGFTSGGSGGVAL